MYGDRNSRVADSRSWTGPGRPAAVTARSRSVRPYRSAISGASSGDARRFQDHRRAIAEHRSAHDQPAPRGRPRPASRDGSVRAPASARAGDGTRSPAGNAVGNSTSRASATAFARSSVLSGAEQDQPRRLVGRLNGRARRRAGRGAALPRGDRTARRPSCHFGGREVGAAGLAQQHEPAPDRRSAERSSSPPTRSGGAARDGAGCGRAPAGGRAQAGRRRSGVGEVGELVEVPARRPRSPRSAAGPPRGARSRSCARSPAAWPGSIVATQTPSNGTARRSRPRRGQRELTDAEPAVGRPDDVPASVIICHAPIVATQDPGMVFPCAAAHAVRHVRTHPGGSPRAARGGARRTRRRRVRGGVRAGRDDDRPAARRGRPWSHRDPTRRSNR